MPSAFSVASIDTIYPFTFLTGTQGIKKTVAPGEPRGSQRFADRLTEVCCGCPGPSVHAARQAASGHKAWLVLPGMLRRGSSTIETMINGNDQDISHLEACL